MERQRRLKRGLDQGRDHHQQHLAGAANIPLSALRLKSRLLDPAARYVAYCDTGRRSATAAFLLKNAGLDVFVLDGGLNGNADTLQDYLK